MHSLKRFAVLVSALVAMIAAEAWAVTLSGGPIPLSVRTVAGHIHGTAVMWKGDYRELVVVNVTQAVGRDQVADLYDTLRMQLSRATAVDLQPSSAARGCCATMSGSGVGFAGNVRAALHLEQKLDGSDRVVQTVVIRNYSGPPMDGYTAKLLFQ